MADASRDLQTKRYGLYLQLLQATPGTPEHASLTAEIEALGQNIKLLEEPEAGSKKQANDLAHPGMRYDEALGVYVAPDKGNASEVKAKIDRLHSYPTRAPGEEITDPQEIADRQWRSQCLRDPISSSQWLNNIQVEAATGKRVTVGTSDLEKFLHKSKDNLPVSFAHIVTGPKEQNHFVSFDIRTGTDSNKPEVTYVDSNGDLMPLAERQALERQIPGVVVKYLNKDGEKISEAEAVRNPDNNLRVQFDEHNCGLYTTHAVNMLRAAGGDSEKIIAGVARLKEISKDPISHRATLGATLREIADNPEREASIQKEFSAHSQAETRLTRRSHAVGNTKGSPAISTVTSKEVAAEGGPGYHSTKAVDAKRSRDIF